MPGWIVNSGLVVKDGMLFIVSGWMVGRLHRDRPTPMLFAYVSAVLALLLAQWVGLGLLAWNGFQIVFQFDVAMVWFVAIPVSILLGGLWGARPDEALLAKSD